jgi:tRNA-specific 2-thiouridylase
MLKAADPFKDQSYFLYRVNRSWLHRLLFPVGAMQKDQVWERAEAIGLPADEIKESQEICFVTKGDYRTFLSQEAPEAERPGAFMSTDGRMLGTHRGTAFYTPGQRRGLGVAADRRLYVVTIDAATNTVVLGDEQDLLATACVVKDVNWLGIDGVEVALQAQVKVRYATAAVKATLVPYEREGVLVTFDVPQRALTPGQSAVFYDGEMVLGGGIIESVSGTLRSS